MQGVTVAPVAEAEAADPMTALASVATAQLEDPLDGRKRAPGTLMCVRALCLCLCPFLQSPPTARPHELPYVRPRDGLCGIERARSGRT